MTQRHERPIKRTNPSGKTRWVARYTGRDGKRRSAGTFKLEREAQAAIDAAYEREYGSGPRRVDTLGAYAATWTRRHPRSERTNATNDARLKAVLDARIDGIALRDWTLGDLRRRHTLDLIDHMLRNQGRAASGAQNILRTLSAMAEDAITDELLEVNPFRGVKIRSSDPRVTKAPRKPRVLSWEQMHTFAAATGKYEPMIRTLSDCGLRLGELLAVHRADWEPGRLHIHRTAHNGVVTDGTKREKMRNVDEDGRLVPIPPTLEDMLRAMPRRIDTLLLFPTPTGKTWWEDNFRADVWQPARERSRIDATPQDFRHSWVTHLRAAGIDHADLADMAGHSVETATATYTHALRQSFDAVKGAIG